MDYFLNSGQQVLHAIHYQIRSFKAMLQAQPPCHPTHCLQCGGIGSLHSHKHLLWIELSSALISKQLCSSYCGTIMLWIFIFDDFIIVFNFWSWYDITSGLYGVSRWDILCCCDTSEMEEIWKGRHGRSE